MSIAKRVFHNVNSEKEIIAAIIGCSVSQPLFLPRVNALF